MTRRAIAVWTVLALSCGACGDDSGGPGGGFTGDQIPTIEVNEGSRSLIDRSVISVSPGTLEQGQESRATELRVINTGGATLTITEVVIESDPPGVFWLVPQDGSELPGGGSVVDVEPQDSTDGLRNYYVDLWFKRPAEGVEATATISVRSNSVAAGERQEVVTFEVELEGAKASIQVIPGQVDFGNVGQEQTEQQGLSILNQGTETLVIDSFVLSGHPSYTLAVGSDQWPVSPETSSVGIQLENPIEVSPGSSENVAVLFKPTGPEPAEGQLIFFSNDPTASSGTVVPLKGNVGGPCIAVNPRDVNFGGKLVGKPATVDVEITSCGDQELEINEIFLGPESSGDFTLELKDLVNAVDPITILTPSDQPVKLLPNQTATFQVQFVPDEINALDGNGQPVPDLGLISIKSNAFIADLDVDVIGFGVEVECPTAVILVQEGEEVIPQTKLHLVGSQSFASTGAIEQYTWTVQQPVGSQSIFVPSASVADPTFEVNVAGTYVFRLSVKDSGGTESCIDGEATVFVNPDEAIHVELVWETPNDPDQTDEGPVAGADLDLHFVHPFATEQDIDGDGALDGYFDATFDTFWFNDQPNWGSFDANIDDNPGLDRDDTDGAGPENINLNGPENGLEYKLGVHYWNDHGFGPSYATIRVFIFANLVFEMSDVELTNHDMWTVGSVAWPSGEVELSTVCSGTTTPCESDAECAGTCGLRIFGPYEHPFFPN